MRSRLLIWKGSRMMRPLMVVAGTALMVFIGGCRKAEAPREDRVEETEAQDKQEPAPKITATGEDLVWITGTQTRIDSATGREVNYIVSVLSDGTGFRVLFPRPVDSFFPFYIDGEGKAVYFRAMRRLEEEPDPNQPNNIYRVDVASGEWHNVFGPMDKNHQVSPDGEKVIWSSEHRLIALSSTYKQLWTHDGGRIWHVNLENEKKSSYRIFTFFQPAGHEKVWVKDENVRRAQSSALLHVPSGRILQKVFPADTAFRRTAQGDEHGRGYLLFDEGYNDSVVMVKRIGSRLQAKDTAWVRSDHFDGKLDPTGNWIYFQGDVGIHRIGVDVFFAKADGSWDFPGLIENSQLVYINPRLGGFVRSIGFISMTKVIP